MIFKFEIPEDTLESQISSSGVVLADDVHSNDDYIIDSRMVTVTPICIELVLDH